MTTMAPRKRATSGAGAGKANPWPKRLFALRKRLGLTQADAAAKVRVSLRSWAAWELGEQIPSSPHQLLITLLESGKI